VNNQQKINLLTQMLRIRMVEEAIAANYAKQKMRTPVHLSIGQEAAAVASGYALRKTDYAVSSHRAHAHYLAKGGNLNAMIAEIHGKVTGCCRGRGGSMHLIDQSVGFMGSTAQPL
jgi:pyruvate dehydrogenase E1 component alpha subunit